jgi:hypothetical protein
MAPEGKGQKSEGKGQKSDKKPESKPGKGEKGDKADKAEGKAAKAKPAAAEAAPPEKPKAPPAPPRPPADPRLKFIKKFHGKFLPRGPLRDRHRALMARWNSGEDHGGVTHEELKSLYTDWRATRLKTRQPAQG